MDNIESLNLKEVCKMLFDSTNDKRLLYANILSTSNPGIDILGLEVMQNKKAKALKEAILYYKDFTEEYYAIRNNVLVVDDSSDVGKIFHQAFSLFQNSLERKADCASHFLYFEDNTHFFSNLLNFFNTEYLECDNFEVPRKSSYLEQNIFCPIHQIIDNSDEIQKRIRQFKEGILCLSADCLSQDLGLTKGELKLISQLIGLNLFKHDNLGWMISKYSKQDCVRNIKHLLDFLKHGEGKSTTNVGMEGHYLGILPIGEDELKKGMVASIPNLSIEDMEMITQILKNSPYFECLGDKYQIKWKNLSSFEAKRIRILADNPGKRYTKEELMKEFNNRCLSYNLSNERNTNIDAFGPRGNRYPFVRSENGNQWIDAQDRALKPMEAIRICLEDNEPTTADAVIAFCKKNGIKTDENSIRRTYLPQIATRILNQKNQSFYVLKEHRIAFIDKGYIFPKEKESRTDVLPLVVNILKQQANREIKYSVLCNIIKEHGYKSHTLRSKLERFPDTFHLKKDLNSNRMIISLVSDKVSDFSEIKSRKSDLLPQVEDFVNNLVEEKGGECSLLDIVSKVAELFNVSKGRARTLLRDKDLRQRFNFINDAKHKRTTVQKKSGVDNYQRYTVPIKKEDLKNYFLTQIDGVQCFDNFDQLLENMYSIMGQEKGVDYIDNLFHELLIELPSYTIQTYQKKNTIRKEALRVLETYLKLFYKARFDKDIIEEMNRHPYFSGKKFGLATILAFLRVIKELPNDDNIDQIIQRKVYIATKTIKVPRNTIVGHPEATINMNETEMSQQIHDVFLIMLYLASRI